MSVSSFIQYELSMCSLVKTIKKSASDLSERLQGFYAGMRKADGSEYKRVSFIATRSALARHVTTFERGFDLITGPEFKQTNKMLGAVVKDKQRNGREPAVQHKQSITDEDWASSRFTSLICSKRAIPGCCLSTHAL